MLEFLCNFILRVDYWLFLQINTVWTHSALDGFFFWITDLHKTLYFKLITIPLFIFLFIKKFKREGLSLFLMLLLTLGLNDFIGGKVKRFVERDRPEYNTAISTIKRSDAGSYSFYSNHAANMFAFATYVGQFLPQTRIPLYGIAGLVAYSRVYNGVHYPSDIFTGSIIGCFLGLLMSYFAKKMLSFLKRRRAES